jgi:hypothetical protein
VPQIASSRILTVALLAASLKMVPLPAQSQQTPALDTIELTKKAKPAIVLIKGLSADNREIGGSSVP